MKAFLLIASLIAALLQSCGLTVDVRFYDPALTPTPTSTIAPTPTLTPTEAEPVPPVECTPTPVPSPTAEVWREIRTTSPAGQWVRIGPGVGFEIVGVMGVNDVCELDIGDDVARVGQSGAWVLVRCEEFEGWAAAWLLELAAYG